MADPFTPVSARIAAPAYDPYSTVRPPEPAAPPPRDAGGFGAALLVAMVFVTVAILAAVILGDGGVFGNRIGAPENTGTVNTGTVNTGTVAPQGNGTVAPAP